MTHSKQKPTGRSKTHSARASLQVAAIAIPAVLIISGSALSRSVIQWPSLWPLSTAHSTWPAPGPLWTGCYVWTPAVALEVHARRKGPARAATHQHYRGLVLRGNLTMSQYSDYNQLSFLVFFPLYLCRLFFSSLLIRPGSSVTLAWDASHDAAGIISYFKMCKFLTVHVGYRVFSAAVGSH